MSYTSKKQTKHEIDQKIFYTQNSYKNKIVRQSNLQMEKKQKKTLKCRKPIKILLREKQ